MTRPLDPRSVFGDQYPHASFHDATLHRLDIDVLKGRASLSLRIWVGDPEERDKPSRATCRSGVLVVTGLLFCALDPPDKRCLYEHPQGLVGLGGLWLADDGEVTAEVPTGAAARLPLPLPEGAFLHYFFVNDWNSFIYLSGRDASFEWDAE